jgi:6-phosphogluconolactonase
LNLQRFATAQDAARAMAAHVADALRGGLAYRSAATLAVPGGRTPVPFFHALREADLDWTRVGVTLTDERRVAPDHEASNAALVRRELLQGRAAAAQFVPLHEGASADAAAGDGAPMDGAWQALASLPRPFDAVVLGMGEDGHFASLFPHSPGLSAALDPMQQPACVSMLAPAEPRSRISLNLAALLQTRRLFLFITGIHKRDLVLSAATAADAALPVAALLAQRVPMPEVYWAP